MYIVERLFSSSLVVVVSLSMPRRMNVYHFKKGTEICNYSYSNNILSVRLNRQVRKRNGSVFSILRVVASGLCYRDLFVTVAAAGGVPGGVDLHPQYQRHETTQDPAQHTHQPLRYTQAVMLTSNVCVGHIESVLSDSCRPKLLYFRGIIRYYRLHYIVSTNHCVEKTH